MPEVEAWPTTLGDGTIPGLSGSLASALSPACRWRPHDWRRATSFKPGHRGHHHRRVPRRTNSLARLRAERNIVIVSRDIKICTLLLPSTYTPNRLERQK